MLQKYVFLVLVSGLLGGVLDGCARFGGSAQPAWIEGTSREYSADQYLLGVGQAGSQSAATERAYAAVAKIFKAEISAQSRDWESYLVLESRGKATTERRLTLDRVTRVSTDKVLENVRILEAWFDRRAGQHYALAGMNRAQAEGALLERIAELDSMVETELNESRQTQDKLATVRNIKRAVGHLVLREAYNADLRVVRTNGRGVDPAYRVAELTAQLEQFLTANLVIGVEVTGEQAEPVRRAVMEGLVREGFAVTARRIGSEAVSGQEGGGAPPELLVKGTVRLWALKVPDPRFTYVRWCSDFLIVEIATQRVVGAVSRGGREGHVTEDQAAARAGRVMQQEVASDLAKTLASYVYGESVQTVDMPPAACPRDDRQSG